MFLNAIFNMAYVPMMDISPIAPVSSLGYILLQQQNVVEAAGWLEFANNLTVPAVLLLGLYFLYKMNAETEAKREANNKELVEKLDKSHNETVAFLSAKLSESEAERKALQDKLILPPTL